MFDLSIVIPTCNRAALLEKCLAAIWSGVERRCEVIVVDGASTDHTPQILANARLALGDRLQVISEEQREGFVRAANKGFAAARGRHLMWLNDDARVTPGSLDRALTQIESSPADVGLLALFHAWKKPKNVAYETTLDGRIYRVLHVRGTLYANFGLGRREIFGRMGFFDARYFMNGADPDFSLKLWNAGLSILPAWGGTIDHDEIEDGRRDEDSPRASRDNELLFARWDLPPKNSSCNDFDPARPCTLRGRRDTALAIAA